MQEFGSFTLFVLTIIGVAVLWSLRLAYRKRGASADDSIRLILTVAGWVMIFGGVLGTALQAFLYGAPLPWITILAIAMMAVGRYRSSENRTLLWCLAAAAERGIPLEHAARSYSLERSDELGIRADRLARLLEGGTPLSLALAATRIHLPLDTLVAVRIGIETGDLGTSLAKVAKFDDDADTLLRSIFEKVFYLAVITNVLIGILMFIMLQIVPVFAKMFDEFGLELPTSTHSLVVLTEFFVYYWFFLFPFVAWLPFFLIVGLLHYIGWLPRNLPLINWFTLRLDGGIVMRCLALAVKQRRPLPEMIWMLAQLYPKSSVRQRLTRAGNAVNGGEHWCLALRRAKLLRPSDVAILTAAERSGNLEWALEEMADSSIRRLAYRMRVAVNVLFPTVLFSFGVFIGYVVVSLFLPLIALITGLAG